MRPTPVPVPTASLLGAFGVLGEGGLVSAWVGLPSQSLLDLNQHHQHHAALLAHSRKLSTQAGAYSAGPDLGPDQSAGS